MSGRRGLGIAVLAALLSAVFVAARSSLPLSAFVVVAAAVALVEGALLTMLRGPSSAFRGALVGLGLATQALYVLGKVLKATTHHRPLGAVTFAFMALFVTGGALLVALRVDAERSASRRGRLVSLGFEIAAALAAGLALLKVLWEPTTQSGAVDVAFALGIAAVLTLLPWPARAAKVLDRVGPWVWGGLVLAGFGLALGPASLVASAASPALAAVFGWF